VDVPLLYFIARTFAELRVVEKFVPLPDPKENAPSALQHPTVA
jgi:hypothetical protein